MNSVISFIQKTKRKRTEEEQTYSSLVFFISSERECDFSLKSRAIGPSDSFGARRKVVLRSEGNAWVPILRSFDKLREVGVLFYLFYS